MLLVLKHDFLNRGDDEAKHKEIAYGKSKAHGYYQEGG